MTSSRFESLAWNHKFPGGEGGGGGHLKAARIPFCRRPIHKLYPARAASRARTYHTRSNPRDDSCASLRSAQFSSTHVAAVEQSSPPWKSAVGWQWAEGRQKQHSTCKSSTLSWPNEPSRSYSQQDSPKHQQTTGAQIPAHASKTACSPAYCLLQCPT